MWLYGRYLEGGIETAWALQTHPCVLQCHIASTLLFCMLSDCHPWKDMVVLMSSVKYASELINPVKML